MPGLSNVLNRIPKPVLVAAAAVNAIVLAYMAWSRPGYFASQTYMGGLILLELVSLTLWRFRQVFFGALILAFLLAGTTLPGASVWTTARWLFLCVGAVAGVLLLLKDHQHRFGLFHAVALFAVLAAVVSGSVSRYPSFALLKVLSLFLLFLYAGSGARLAVKGRESAFFAGLLLGCEVLVSVFALYYFLEGSHVVGNANSLGAILGVAVAPLLLWGTFVATDVFVSRRRFALFVLCAFLVYQSHARAGIAALALSCGLLCVGLRRYRNLILGATVALASLAAAAIIQPEQVLETASNVTSQVMYKGSRDTGIFASRETPWQNAVKTIRNHFWFGTGFGTSDKSERATNRSENLSFSSASHVTTEYGSSYLAIATWVGMLGVLPFLFLLILLIGKVFRTFVHLRRTGNAFHPAIPLAMVIAAGLVHAAFEDWMFAPGYYLCVFYWSMAFVLVDLAPVAAPRVVPRGLWQSPRSPQGYLDVASDTA